MRFAALCERILTDWRLLGPLLMANALGMAFGWYYYFDVGQFDPLSRYYEAAYWWPLVADSPNALLVFVAAVLLRRAGRRNAALDAAAFVLNVYVGLWTTFLFLAYADQMGTFEGSANSVLFVTHLGMPLQAFLLAPDLARDRLRWQHGLVGATAAAVYIGVDYWGPHLHPAPFLAPDDGLLHAVSPFLMAGALLAWVVVGAWRRGEIK